MAITANLYRLLSSLEVPDGSTLLEIGQANWYGDINPSQIYKDRSGEGRHFRFAQMAQAIGDGNLFRVARCFYEAWFNPSRIVSVDMHGPNALKLDLNQAFSLGERYDVVINHGTAEHIFNIAQVFETIHYCCDDGGLMIHDSPFTGWIDHGFYCLQPTLFYDLAHANCYEVARVAIHSLGNPQIIEVNGRDHIAELAKWEQIPANAQLFVALRKYGEQPFRVPMQGYYARTLSEAGNRAWECLR